MPYAKTMFLWMAILLKSLLSSMDLDMSRWSWVASSLEKQKSLKDNDKLY